VDAALGRALGQREIGWRCAPTIVLFLAPPNGSRLMAVADAKDML